MERYAPEETSVSAVTRVLVTGAELGLGRALICQLVKARMTPVALTGDICHDPATIERDVHYPCELPCQLDTHDTTTEAAASTEVIIHAAAATARNGQCPFETTVALTEAALETGAHLVLISRVNCDTSSIPHRKRLAEAEALLESTDGLNYSIQRITHTHEDLATILASSTVLLPKVSPIQPVSSSDAAERIVALIQTGPSGRVEDYAGPELMRLKDFAQIYKQVRGHMARFVWAPPFGGVKETKNGIHVTQSGDRGTTTFRDWL